MVINDPEKDFSFKSFLHLAVLHFDEIVGPNLLQIYPDKNNSKDEEINKVLQQLIDVGSLRNKEEWEFVYSDSHFSSINVFIRIVNQKSRGSNAEFMISLILHPTYPQTVSAMALDWNSIFEIKTNCFDLLVDGVKNSTLNQIGEQLKFVLSNLFDRVKENLLFTLDFIDPNSFEIE